MTIPRLLTPALFLLCSLQGCIIGSNWLVDNQPLNNPVIPKSFRQDGTVVLEDGTAYRIVGIRRLHPIIQSLADVNEHVCRPLRDEIEIEPLPRGSDGVAWANVYVAAGFYRCGNLFCSDEWFPHAYPRYDRELLARLLLSVGLCEVDPDLEQSNPQLYAELKRSEGEAKERKFGIWGDTHYFMFDLTVCDESGQPVGGAEVRIERGDCAGYISSHTGSDGRLRRTWRVLDGDDVYDCFTVTAGFPTPEGRRDGFVESILPEEFVSQGDDIYRIERTLTVRRPVR